MNTLIWIILAGILFFFMIFVPVSNQRKMKREHDEMRAFQAKLEKGNEVVMMNGIHGEIEKIDTNTVHIEIAPKVVIEVEKTVIVGVKH